MQPTGEAHPTGEPGFRAGGPEETIRRGPRATPWQSRPPGSRPAYSWNFARARRPGEEGQKGRRLERDGSSPSLQPSSPPARPRASASPGRGHYSIGACVRPCVHARALEIHPRSGDGRSRWLIYPRNSLLRLPERQSSLKRLPDAHRPDRHHWRPADGLGGGRPGSSRFTRNRLPALRHQRRLPGRLPHHLCLCPRPLPPRCPRLPHTLPLLCGLDAPHTLSALRTGSGSYAKNGGV